MAELVGEFDRIVKGKEDSSSGVELAALAREVVGEAEGRAARHGVRNNFV